MKTSNARSLGCECPYPLLVRGEAEIGGSRSTRLDAKGKYAQDRSCCKLLNITKLKTLKSRGLLAPSLGVTRSEACANCLDDSSLRRILTCCPALCRACPLLSLSAWRSTARGSVRRVAAADSLRRTSRGQHTDITGAAGAARQAEERQ